MHDIDQTVARLHKQNRVQRRHIDSLGQAACIRKNSAPALGRTLQPVNPLSAVERIMLAVNMLYFELESRCSVGFRKLLNRLFDDADAMLRHPLR